MFEDRPAVGLGAGNFRARACATEPTPRAPATLTATSPQTLADLGIVGLAA